MKKLLYLAAFVAAVTFTACNKGIGSLPTELRQEVEQADQEIKTALESAKHSGEMQEMQQYGLEFDYEGVALEGRSIIFQFKLGGDMMNIISFSALAENLGFSQSDFEQAVRRGEIFQGMETDDLDMMRMMREYKYNIGIRIRGNMKDDVITYVVDYENLPEDNKYYDYDILDGEESDLDSEESALDAYEDYDLDELLQLLDYDDLDEIAD